MMGPSFTFSILSFLLDGFDGLNGGWGERRVSGLLLNKPCNSDMQRQGTAAAMANQARGMRSHQTRRVRRPGGALHWG